MTHYYILVILLLLFILCYNGRERFSDNPDIPNTIWLTYKTKNVPDKVVSNWRNLNPEYDIEFYDHDDVYNYLLENYNREFADFHKEMPYGAIKGDIFRLAILYQYGGVYSDVDNHPLVPIKDFLPSDVQLCTVYNEPNGRIAQAFICTIPKNPVIKASLDIMINKLRIRKKYKEGKIKCPWGNNSEYNYLIGTIDFATALKEYLNVQKLSSGMIETPEQKIYLLEQICPPSDPHLGCYFTDDSGKKLMMARYPDYGKTW